MSKLKKSDLFDEFNTLTLTEQKKLVDLMGEKNEDFYRDLNIADSEEAATLVLRLVESTPSDRKHKLIAHIQSKCSVQV